MIYYIFVSRLKWSPVFVFLIRNTLACEEVRLLFDLSPQVQLGGKWISVIVQIKVLAQVIHLDVVQLQFENIQRR